MVASFCAGVKTRTDGSTGEFDEDAENQSERSSYFHPLTDTR